MSQKPKKDCVIALRVTQTQRIFLSTNAQAADQKLAAHLRALVISRSPVVREPSQSTKRLLLIYEKAGKDLNRIAHLINSAFYRGVISELKFKQWTNSVAAVAALATSVQMTMSIPPFGADPDSLDVPESSTADKQKTEPISFRLYTDEYAMFFPLITRAGVSPSHFFRELIFNDSPVFITSPDIRKRLIFVANKSSNNLTQLSYRVQTALQRGVVTPALSAKWLDMLLSIESFLALGIAHGD